jgi:hypothetical protein
MFGFSLRNLIIGLVMAGLGVAMVKYTFQLVNITGTQGWLERYTGSGSTYGIYKIVGVLVALIGLILASGLGNAFMDTLFSPLRSIFHPFD